MQTAEKETHSYIILGGRKGEKERCKERVSKQNHSPPFLTVVTPTNRDENSKKERK